MWINGPFGGGKTATAYELQWRLEGAVVCDPEEVGFGLRRMMPSYLWTDFQELTSWRAGVLEVLDLVATKHPGPVLVPMTLVEPGYVEEVIGGLRGRGHDVRHFALLARPDTVRQRLKRRGVYGLRRDRWALDQVDRCLDQLTTPGFADPVDTEGRTVAEVAEEIAQRAGLALAPNQDGRGRAWLRRTVTSVRHIRLDLSP